MNASLAKVEGGRAGWEGERERGGRGAGRDVVVVVVVGRRVVEGSCRPTVNTRR